MIQFLANTGPFKWPLLILTVTIAVLIIKKSIDLFTSKERTRDQMERGLHAILFWGAFSAVMGVYGQLSGIYRALQIIAGASDISPSVILEGFTISFTTTMYGLVLFMVAGLSWFILLSRYRKLVRESD